MINLAFLIIKTQDSFNSSNDWYT